MFGSDFHSLFSEKPQKTWQSGLGLSGGSWRVQASSLADDAADDDRFGAFQQAWKRGASNADLFGDNPFQLGGSVGAGSSANRRADVAKVETFLGRAGYYRPLKGEGPSGYVNTRLDEAIRAFQADNGLQVDGILKPGGPTISTLAGVFGGMSRSASPFTQPKEFAAARDFSDDGERNIDPEFAILVDGRSIDPGFARHAPSTAIPMPQPQFSEDRGNGEGIPWSEDSLFHPASMQALGQGEVRGDASGMVHVRAYEQTRDGEEVQVSDYVRRRPGTGAGADAAGGRGEPSSLLRLADSGAVKADAAPEKQPPNLHPHVTLEFDGHELRAIEDGEVVRRWPAVSGRPGFQGAEHQGEKDKGPLPEGDWILRQSERQDIKDISIWNRMRSATGIRGSWRGLENSWGNTRVWLEPGEGTDTKGRSGFSVHGGAEPGSAGCIDLTSHMDDFAGYFSGLGKDVSIRVRYPE